MAMSVRIIPFWIFTAFSKGYHHKINIFLAFYLLKNVLFPVCLFSICLFLCLQQYCWQVTDQEIIRPSHKPVTWIAYLSQTDGPCPVGCSDDFQLNDKVVPSVWPPPPLFLLAAAAPHFRHDLAPPCPCSARYNQDAHCH